MTTRTPFTATDPVPSHDPDVEPPHAGVRAATNALSRPWHLAVLTGPDTGLVLPVPAEGTLGRGEVLTDPAVSRHHLTLVTTTRTVLVADAGSSNGTYVRRWFWWRRLGRRRARCREGALVLVGDTILELRRRPRDLAVPAPGRRSRRRWMRAALMTAMLMVAVSAAIATRATGRGAYGVLALSPMVLMTVMRLGSFPGRERMRGSGQAGWRGRNPDPASMLLSLVVRADDQMSATADDGPRAAWLPGRGAMVDRSDRGSGASACRYRRAGLSPRLES